MASRGTIGRDRDAGRVAWPPALGRLVLELCGPLIAPWIGGPIGLLRGLTRCGQQLEKLPSRPRQPAINETSVRPSLSSSSFEWRSLLSP